MLTANKYRLYPSENQEILLNRHFGCKRWVYNQSLMTMQEHYKLTGKTLSAYDLHAILVNWKQQYPWLYDVCAQSLQQSINDLHTAFINFFKKRSRYPQYKSKKSRQSIRFPQSNRVDPIDQTITVVKVGTLDAIIHRPIFGELKSVTISKDRCDKYHAAILTDDSLDSPKTSYLGKVLGVDLGLTDLITTSDGCKIANPKHFNRRRKNLKRKQQALARCKIGSKRRAKAKLRVAKIHAKIANARKDFLHKLSRQMVDENQVIVFETLSVRNMIRNRHLAHAIGSAGWSQLIDYSTYKARREGKVVLQAPMLYPSSKRCSCCGKINTTLKLSDREWVCDGCLTHHDRDHNAGQNLKQWGELEIYPAVKMEQQIVQRSVH